MLVPLSLAGEANAPLACLVGSDPDRPTLLAVPQPRNRDLRFGFAAALAGHLVSYLDSFAYRLGPDGTTVADAPQLLVPNDAGVAFLRLLGRSTRFRRTHGEWAVPRPVPLLGRWLTFLAERADNPGSSLLVSMTRALSLHWASGQSPMEDANLAALVGWIDPPAGLSGAQAALEAERPEVWPPAGPVTDPTFDTTVLGPLLRSYDREPHPQVVREIEAALRSQTEPTWDLMWRGVALLGTLAPGGSVADRWLDDRRAFQTFHAYVAQGGPPQPRRDSAVAAAQRLHRLERQLTEYEAQRAFDDPLVMAEHRLSGEAFVGTVVSSEPTRVDATGSRRKLRPHIVVRTADPVLLEPGATVRSPARLKQDAVVVAVDGGDIRLELSGGMGRALTPAPGSVPDVGDEVCYTALAPGFQPTAAFPPREETPWTHGGPPPQWEPLDDAAAVEEWQ